MNLGTLHDELQIKMTQNDMRRAVQHYLNTFVFQQDCTVTNMVESRVNDTSTWAVDVQGSGIAALDKEKEEIDCGKS